AGWRPERAAGLAASFRFSSDSPGWLHGQAERRVFLRPEPVRHAESGHRLPGAGVFATGPRWAGPEPRACGLVRGVAGRRRRRTGGARAGAAEFGVLASRIRDRLSTLRECYDEGPLAIDFAARVR